MPITPFVHFLRGVLSGGIFYAWRFAPWRFVLVAFFPWRFFPVAFYPDTPAVIRVASGVQGCRRSKKNSKIFSQNFWEGLNQNIMQGGEVSENPGHAYDDAAMAKCIEKLLNRLL